MEQTLLMRPYFRRKCISILRHNANLGILHCQATSPTWILCRWTFSGTVMFQYEALVCERSAL